MTVIELFHNCRNAVLELNALDFQLQRIDLSGAPSGAHTQKYNTVSHGTNNASAAKVQLYDGLCAQRDRLSEDIAGMQEKILSLCKLLPNARAQVVLTQYYLLGMTDHDIAAAQYISRTNVNAIRHHALKQLCHKVSSI